MFVLVVIAYYCNVACYLVVVMFDIAGHVVVKVLVVVAVRGEVGFVIGVVGVARFVLVVFLVVGVVVVVGKALVIVANCVLW